MLGECAKTQEKSISLLNHEFFRVIKEVHIVNRDSNRSFDKVLAEDKMNSERIAQERDNAERDAREKETKLLNLNREFEDTMGRLEESERSKRTLQNELDELVNSQGNADKNVHELEKAKRALEAELGEMKQQMEELEDELQVRSMGFDGARKLPN